MHQQASSDEEVQKIHDMFNSWVIESFKNPLEKRIFLVHGKTVPELLGESWYTIMPDDDLFKSTEVKKDKFRFDIGLINRESVKKYVDHIYSDFSYLDEIVKYVMSYPIYSPIQSEYSQTVNLDASKMVAYLYYKKVHSIPIQINLSTPMMRLHYAAISPELLDYSEYQTWWNSSSGNVKLFSVIASKSLKLNGFQFHGMRMMVAKLMNPELKVKVKSFYTLGLLRPDGKSYLVSGHYFNQLVQANFGLINIRDVHRHMIGMFERHSIVVTRKKFKKQKLSEKKALKDDIFIELPLRYGALWHSVSEYRDAFPLFILVMGYSDLSISTEVIIQFKRMYTIAKAIPGSNDPSLSALTH